MTKDSILIFLMLFLSSMLKGQSSCNNINSTIWNTYWMSCQPSSNPNSIRGNSHWVMYDLGAVYDLSAMWIWNINKTGELNTGFKNVVIEYTTSLPNWSLLGTFEFEKASGENDYSGFKGPNFNNKRARYVLITAIDNWGASSCYGLTEVRFNITEPNQIEELNTGIPPTLYALELSTDGNGNAISDVDKSLYIKDEAVAITATGNSQYEFSHWSGDVSGSQNPLNISITEHMNIVANFVQEALPNCQDDELSPSGEITNGEYIAQSKISSSGTVMNQREVTFRAGNNIELLNGFQVDQGGVFNAMIKGCVD